jgi:hypothetical protein
MKQNGICVQKDIWYWGKKGLADSGDPSAYIGAVSKPKAQILEQCGRTPRHAHNVATALSTRLQ